MSAIASGTIASTVTSPPMATRNGDQLASSGRVRNGTAVATARETANGRSDSPRAAAGQPPADEHEQGRRRGRPPGATHGSRPGRRRRTTTAATRPDCLARDPDGSIAVRFEMGWTMSTESSPGRCGRSSAPAARRRSGWRRVLPGDGSGVGSTSVGLGSGRRSPHCAHAARLSPRRSALASWTSYRRPSRSRCRTTERDAREPGQAVAMAPTVAGPWHGGIRPWSGIRTAEPDRAGSSSRGRVANQRMRRRPSGGDRRRLTHGGADRGWARRMRRIRRSRRRPCRRAPSSRSADRGVVGPSGGGSIETMPGAGHRHDRRHRGRDVTACVRGVLDVRR